MQALVQQVHWLHKPKTKHLFLPLVFFFPFFLSSQPADLNRLVWCYNQLFSSSLLEISFSGCRNWACRDSIRLAILFPAKLHQIVFEDQMQLPTAFLLDKKKDKENATAAGNKSSYGFSHHFHWVVDDLPACKYVIWECGIWNTSQPWGVCIPVLWIKNICNCNGHPSEHAHSDWIRAAYLSCVNCDLMTGRGCLFTANQTWQFKSANIQWCQGVRGLNGGGGGGCRGYWTKYGANSLLKLTVPLHLNAFCPHSLLALC